MWESVCPGWREQWQLPVKIGDLTAKLPIIQGGMGVGISLSSLAGAVAGAGGIGIISTAQIGFREPDFDRDPIACNLRTIGKEIEKANDRLLFGKMIFLSGFFLFQIR